MTNTASPQSAEWYLNQGIASLQNGSDLQAKELLIQALQIDPKISTAHAALSQIFTKLGDQNQAFTHLTLAIEITPSLVNSDVHLDIARMHSDRGDYSNALACCSRALIVRPKDAKAYLQMAQVHQASGRWDKAEESLLDALASDPNLNQYNPHNHVDFSVPSRLAELRSARYVIKEKVQNALTAFPKYQKIVDDAFHAGNQFVQQYRFQEAVEAYQQAVAADPQHAAAHYCLGVVLTHYGPYAKGNFELLVLASRCFSRVIELEPNLTLGYCALGTVSFEVMIREGSLMSQGPAVIQMLQQAIAIDPECADAYQQIFNILYQQGKLVESMPYMEKGIQLETKLREQNPLSKLGMVFLTEVTYSMGHMSEALETLVKLEKLGWAPERTKVIFAPPGRVANPCLLDYWRQHFLVISDPKQIEDLTSSRQSIKVPFKLANLTWK